MCDLFRESGTTRYSGTTAAKFFNTVEDYARDNVGEVVRERSAKINLPNGQVERINNRGRSSDYVPSSAMTEAHLYEYDNLDNFKRTIDKQLVETDGWFGFINPSTLEIENYSGICLNKCMNNNKYAEQIDMYPDRSLYSFLPKENKHRNRKATS